MIFMGLINNIDVDAVLGIKTSVNMMDPMSFTLTVTRNLSFAWYTDVPEMNLSGHLKSVEVTKKEHAKNLSTI